MLDNKVCFTTFSQPVNDHPLPDKFTFPYCYQPQPIALLAAKQLQQHLAFDNYWADYFNCCRQGEKVAGKMFGVLVVKNNAGQLGFLSAFSGTISSNIPGFVPPIVDLFAEDSFFLAPQKKINQITDTLKHLSHSPLLQNIKHQLQALTVECDDTIARHRVHMIGARKHRKQLRIEATKNPLTVCITTLMTQLAQQSVKDKNQLKSLVQQKESAIQPLSKELEVLNQEINHLKQQRKLLSNTLQQQIFSQFRFLNCGGEEKNLIELFKNTPQKTPPAGSGECAAPKLLHYAFKSELMPIALAEFWWGAAPKSAVRKHLNYYGACLGKCKPILTHMLAGMNVEDNPLLNNPAKDKKLIVIYEDDALVIINKPAELLSVPGKNIKDSVYSRIKQDFPLATGPLIVHRLDMSTSGLMVIALNKKAHKALQRQFINRTIIKHYVALVDGLIEQKSGTITLALCGDHHDRPRQKVCPLQGKPAETEWHVIEHYNNRDLPCTKVSLSPKTGRTHQLRVHCAHFQGLNKPIIGDDLYGTSAERLYLHAQSLKLVHPISKKSMKFSCKVPF